MKHNSYVLQKSFVTVAALFLSKSALAVSVSDDDIEPEINMLWQEEVIVDGLLEPIQSRRDENGVWVLTEGDNPKPRYQSIEDFSIISEETQNNVFIGKIKGVDSGFSAHADRFDDLDIEPTLNIVKDSGDLSCSDVKDNVPEFIIYQQKTWPIDFNSPGQTNQQIAQENVQMWVDKGLRIMQLEYSASENARLYEPGEQYAGQYGSDTSTYQGLTDVGEITARELIKKGVILDVSHSKTETVSDVIALSREYSQRRNRAVPVFANHANLKEFKNSSRNKSLDQACDIASTGGVIGVMPVAGFMSDGDSFFDLVDQIDALKNYNCNVTSWDNKPISMINHISVASDSGVDYMHESDRHYVDTDAENTNRWKVLANYMFHSRGYSLEEIKKIFGANILRALRLGLAGQLPFEEDRCEVAGEQYFYTGDFNGDGKKDVLLQSSQGNSLIDYAYRGGQFDGTDWDRRESVYDRNWCYVNSNRKLFVGDFNGDGRDDLMCHQSDGQTWIDYASFDGKFYGTNWSRSSSTNIDPDWCRINANRKLYIGDFNGDGRDDILCHQSDGRTWIDFANSRGQFYGTDWSRDKAIAGTDRSWCSINDNRQLIVGDMNGDGRDDLLCQNNEGRTWIDFADNSGHFGGTDWSRDGAISGTDRSWCSIGSAISLLVGDFNGNGQADLLCHSRRSGSLYLDTYSSYSKFFGTNWSNTTAGFCKESFQQLEVADVNGDGLDDLLCYDNHNGHLRTHFGQSTGRLIDEIKQ